MSIREDGSVVGEQKGDEREYEEDMVLIRKKPLLAASVSFSSTVPRGSEIGLTEFKRSCFATFYYRTKDGTITKNAHGVPNINKEHYGFHQSRRITN